MKKLISCILVITMLLSISGCSYEKAKITTTVYPVKYLVEYLAGDMAEVNYLSEEEYIGRANIVNNYDAILKNTDLLIYIGELEPYMDVYPGIFENYDFEIINLASLSAINNFKRYTITELNGLKIVQENTINFYENELFANIDTYSKDPFIWLDPIAMSSMASTIKDWLQEAYPSESLKFENRFKALQQQLVQMDVEYAALKERKYRKLVTVEPTFGNWQRNYGIEVYPLIVSKYNALPTEEQLAYIEQQIRDNGVKYIVYDETVMDETVMELYEKVQKDCNLTEIRLSSLSILSEDDKEKNKDYLTIMLQNLTELEEKLK